MIGSNAVIKCSSVSKKYHIVEGNQFWKILINDYVDSVEALKEVSMEVPKGELVGILGRNGSGKSTFLRVVGGVYSPSNGIINVSGDLSAIYELGVWGNELLTGRKYAERWLRFCNLCSSTDVKKYIVDIQEFSELEEYFDKPIHQYSTGMKTRLFFAVATAIPGKIYLIDEVLSVGDEYFQAKCWRRLRDYFWQGASGILVTHDWTSVIKLCRKAYVFEKGEVQDSGNSSEVVQRYLGLEKPISNTVNFKESMPKQFFGKSSEDLLMNIPIEVHQQGQVFISYSIEMFGIGDGWEHLLHLENTPTHIIKPGSYQIQIKIPRLPLGTGEYSLNVFLMQQTENGKLTFADVRSWTYGNGLSLFVNEGQGKGSLQIPMTWNIEEVF